jgi:GntR family transcriptional regulator
VKTAVASGAIRAGDPLPSIRPLAEELRVNRNTVAKAYTELESQGVVEALAGKGCFVRSGTSPYRKEVRRSLLAEALDDAVIQAHHLQVGRGDFLELARERFDALQTQRARAGGA